MNISLPEELKSYVEGATAKGYSTPSEFVRELIRQDKQRRVQERLEQMLLEGLDSGATVPANQKFWKDLKREAFDLLAAHKKPTKKRR